MADLKACSNLLWVHKPHSNSLLSSFNFFIKCSKFTQNSRKRCKLDGFWSRVSVLLIKNSENKRWGRRILVCSAGKLGFQGEKCRIGEDKLGCLLSEYGWRVRNLIQDEEEMRSVAEVQAEAFHVSMGFFDDFFFKVFKAEVLSGLLYKIRNSAPNRYACLVAEANDAPDLLRGSQRGLVGVVDVTVLRDEAVLRHLEGAEEYLYVSGIAVLRNFRRKKVATVLLRACDLLSLLWGFDYLALRAYEDDSAARKLYSNAGYIVVSRDPPWFTTWIGRKRRILMIKRSPLRDWY